MLTDYERHHRAATAGIEAIAEANGIEPLSLPELQAELNALYQAGMDHDVTVAEVVAETADRILPLLTLDRGAKLLAVIAQAEKILNRIRINIVRDVFKDPDLHPDAIENGLGRLLTLVAQLAVEAGIDGVVTAALIKDMGKE